MPITAEQKRQRQHYIGASDVPCILGVDPWRNVHDLWLEKTGRLVQDDEVTPWQDTGLQLEGALLDWFKRSKHYPKGARMRQNVEVSHKATNIKSHPDAMLYRQSTRLACVEAKTTGLFGPVRESWGDWMTDKVPTRVFIQCTAQMLCAGVRRCYVPAFIGMRGIGCFVVMWKQNVADMIIKAVNEFNAMCKSDTPPTITPSLETLGRVRREPNKTITRLDAKSVVENWIDEKENANQCKKDADTAKAEVLKLMGDAEVMDFGGSNGCLTYFADKRGIRTLRISNNVGESNE